jgi:hypothetical protein
LGYVGHSPVNRWFREQQARDPREDLGQFACHWVLPRHGLASHVIGVRNIPFGKIFGR